MRELVSAYIQYHHPQQQDHIKPSVSHPVLFNVFRRQWHESFL
jgi:hypothetical protein